MFQRKRKKKFLQKTSESNLCVESGSLKCVSELRVEKTSMKARELFV
jgi:hypothetical protein